MSDEQALLERYPALQRLRHIGVRRRVPVILQLTASECGLACVAMALAYHGRWVGLDALRDLAGVGRDGCDALTLLQLARRHGLQGRGLSLEVEDLAHLPPGSILHWEFNHFVVLERLDAHGAQLVDPALGRRRVPIAELRGCFTGVALSLEAGADMDRGGARPNSLLRYLTGAVQDARGVWRILWLSLLLQLFALALPVATGAVVDRVVPLGDGQLLAVVASGVAALLLFNFASTLVRGQLLLELRTKLDLRLTLRFLEHMLSLPLSFFQRRLAGDLLMRLNSHTTLREVLTEDVLTGLLDAALVSAYLVLIFAIDARAGMLVTCLGLLQIGIALAARRRQRALLAESLQVQAKAEAYQVELITGVESIKAAGAEQRALDAWTHLFIDTLHAGLARGRLAALVDASSNTLRLGSPLLTLVWGADQVLDGSLSLGTMLGLNALAFAFLNPLATLVATAGKLQLLASYFERIADVLSAEAEQDLRARRTVPRVDGRIELDHVSFRYNPLAPLVVRDVSVAIEPGRFVAIVGPSGSGKSTLARLMLGLHAPSEGRVLLDGADLSRLELGSVRRGIGVAVQQPHMFSTSVRMNIALNDPEVPLAAIIAAAKLAHIHDEISAMPMGYDTPIIAGGSTLSGGQLQRIALARALVNQPALLLLDEATSALDALTERKVQDSLASLQATRIVVAHRLSTVVHADAILVMVNGHLVEQGTHNQLLASNGTYHQLVQTQLVQT